MKKAFVLALVVSFLGLIAVSQDAHARRNGTCPDDHPKRSAGCTDDNRAVEQIAKRGADDNNPTDDKGGKGEGEKIAKRGADDNNPTDDKGGKGEGEKIAKGGADDNPKPEGTEKVG